MQGGGVNFIHVPKEGFFRTGDLCRIEKSGACFSQLNLYPNIPSPVFHLSTSPLHPEPLLPLQQR